MLAICGSVARVDHLLTPINLGACLLFLSLSPEEQGDMGWQTDVVSSRYLSWRVWKNGKNLLLKNWTIRLEPTKGSSCDLLVWLTWVIGGEVCVKVPNFCLEGKKVWCDLVCECVYRISVWVCFGRLLVNICLKHLDMPVLLKLWYALVLICVSYKFRVTFALAHVHFCPGVSKTHYQ